MQNVIKIGARKWVFLTVQDPWWVFRRVRKSYFSPQILHFFISQEHGVL